jgi:hypothetical protein
VRSKHVLIEFKKGMCYIDGQKNKYSALSAFSNFESSLKYGVIYDCAKNSFFHNAEANFFKLLNYCFALFSSI